MSRIVTFGEIMMRLNPPGYLRILQTDSFTATYSGGEANVAVSLANFGQDAAFVTKVPAHEIGQASINALRRYGVDTSLIVRGGDRLGVYFVEKGASQRSSKVIYDRAGSSIAMSKREEYDWEKFWTEQTDFILQESLQRSGENSLRSAWMHAGQQKRRGSVSPVT